MTRHIQSSFNIENTLLLVLILIEVTQAKLHNLQSKVPLQWSKHGQLEVMHTSSRNTLTISKERNKMFHLEQHIILLNTENFYQGRSQGTQVVPEKR